MSTQKMTKADVIRLAKDDPLGLLIVNAVGVRALTELIDLNLYTQESDKEILEIIDAKTKTIDYARARTRARSACFDWSPATLAEKVIVAGLEQVDESLETQTGLLQWNSVENWLREEVIMNNGGHILTSLGLPIVHARLRDIVFQCHIQHRRARSLEALNAITA